MKISRPKIKRKVHWARIWQILFALYFLSASLENAVAGRWGVAVAYLIFTTSVILYWFSTRIVAQQAAIIARQQELNEDLLKTNRKLMDAITANLRDRTIEDLERGRKATWS